MHIVTLLCLTILVCTSAAAETFATFHPCPSTSVDVKVNNSSIDYTVTKSATERKKSVSLEIESRPYLELGDFNFDGIQDFSVWYLDEGMGKHTIHRVFIFDPNLSDFFEATPLCGDEFLNLRVDKAKRVLISTYYVNSQPIICSTRLKKSRLAPPLAHRCP